MLYKSFVRYTLYIHVIYNFTIIKKRDNFYANKLFFISAIDNSGT